jgi:hemerythrin-like domain-containing protein
MSTASTLAHQHRVTEQVLNCLERMIERCESRRVLESQPARDMIAFFRGFVDGCHDRTVETLLIPSMRAIGMSPEQCLGCSVHQERDARAGRLDAMEAAIKRASAGHDDALKQFVRHARAYIELVMEYMAGQEDCLVLMRARARGDANHEPPATSDKESDEDVARNTYVDLANRLADHFGVPPATIASDAAAGNGRDPPS